MSNICTDFLFSFSFVFPSLLQFYIYPKSSPSYSGSFVLTPEPHGQSLLVVHCTVMHGLQWIVCMVSHSDWFCWWWRGETRRGAVASHLPPFPPRPAGRRSWSQALSWRAVLRVTTHCSPLSTRLEPVTHL